MKTIVILMVTDSVYQSGAYWRSSGPFTHLRQTSQNDYRFMWVPADKLQWSDIAGCDLMFMHRPYHDVHFNAYVLAKDFNIPIWIDVDDLITEIPHDNETHDQYMNRDSISNMVKMLATCDVLSVSTNELKRRLDQYRPKKDALIINNAVDVKRWNWRNVEKRAPVKRVLWRGSRHHQKDLIHVKDDIIKLANERKDWEFYFSGFKPWYIIESTENCMSVSPTDVISFHKFLHQIRPDITMVPLFDNPFNRCKSNIAAIEGTMAGGMVVCPDMEEWYLDGVLNYISDNFYSAMNLACDMVDEGKHIPAMEKTWECIQRRYALKAWNVVREDIIRHLVHRDISIDEEIEQDQKLVYGAKREFKGPTLDLQI